MLGEGLKPTGDQFLPVAAHAGGRLETAPPSVITFAHAGEFAGNGGVQFFPMLPANNQWVLDWNVVAGYATGVWAVGGPLLGVLLGAKIAVRNLRKQRISDHKREEYRELLSAVSEGLVEFTRLQQVAIPNPNETEAVDRKVFVAIHDRIFTWAKISGLQIFPRWNAAITQLKQSEDRQRFSESMGRLLQDIRETALRDIAED